MVKTLGRQRGRTFSRTTFSRLTVAALTAALVATTTGAHAARDPRPSLDKSVQAKAPTKQKQNLRRAAGVAAPLVQPLLTSEGDYLYGHTQTGTGGYGERQLVGAGWETINHAAQLDNDADGTNESSLVWDQQGFSYFSGPDDEQFRQVGYGWGPYNRIFSPGNLGGAPGYDVLGRDAAGVLWLYLGYGDGTFTSRIRVGDGWNYTQILGLGDITGDGKADVFSRDTAGILWLHAGTGEWRAPFKARVRAGAGWNMHNNVLGAGDVDLDGIPDLLARGNDGVLWRYSGTGKDAPQLKAGVKISTANWNTYRLMF